MLTHREQQILDALEPRAQEEGLDIVTVQISGAKKAPTIRVYVDAPDGVSFDVLTAAQAWIDAIMDEIDPFPGAYVLEVSSPGIDRPLRTPAHFARFVGQEAQVSAKPIDGRGSWTGTIVAADDAAVTLMVDGRECLIPFDGMKRAHLKGTVDFKR